jgi:hypothetical protein
MSDERTPQAHVRIDAAELNRVDVTDDGRRLSLRLRDRDGRHASVSLPVDCLGAILTAVPRPADGVADGGDAVHPLEAWSLEQSADGLRLTLRLSDGGKITVAVKSWQIAAIASLAGQDGVPHGQRLN